MTTLFTIAGLALLWLALDIVHHLLTDDDRQEEDL